MLPGRRTRWTALLGVALLAAAGCRGAHSLHASRGHLILGGNELQPPYEFRVKGNRLIVNGYQVKPVVLRSPKPIVHAPITPQILRRSRFDQRLNEHVAALRREGKSESEVWRAAQADLIASGMVDSMVMQPGGMKVFWPGDSAPERIPYPLPGSSGGGRPPTAEEVRRQDAAEMVSDLNSDGMILIGDGYEIHVPHVRVSEMRAGMSRVRAGKSVPDPNLIMTDDVIRDLLRPLPLDSLRAR